MTSSHRMAPVSPHGALKNWKCFENVEPNLGVAMSSNEWNEAPPHK